jgi:hypothetical protein
MSSNNDDLDLPIWGAEAIGRCAGVFADDGSVDLRRTFYLLEKRLLPADKFGRIWASNASSHPTRFRRRSRARACRRHHRRTGDHLNAETARG